MQQSSESTLSAAITNTNDQHIDTWNNERTIEHLQAFITGRLSLEHLANEVVE